MKVILKEREFDYASDYPNGWQEAAGDAFKCPVYIDKYECFIKRFEKKTPGDISGWDLLNALRGKFVPYIPRIYDIVSTAENRKEVHYLFQEYLNGETLDKIINRGNPVDLKKLTNDLFTALKSLHDNNFWYADFCAKNIFYENERKRFLLIDLDSAQPADILPHVDMWGDKEYWALVFNFYKEICGHAEFKASDVPGPILNYLQVIFLVLRLKLSIEYKKYEYKSRKLYGILPALLHKTDSIFKEIFDKAYEDGKHCLQLTWAGEIKDIITREIIEKDLETLIENTVPVINSFRLDKYESGNDGTFSLEWDVDNVDHLELFRNGMLYKRLSPREKSINLKEFYDGKPRRITYKLTAINDFGSTESEPVTVIVSHTIYEASSKTLKEHRDIDKFENDEYFEDDLINTGRNDDEENSNDRERELDGDEKESAESIRETNKVDNDNAGTSELREKNYKRILSNGRDSFPKTKTDTNASRQEEDVSDGGKKNMGQEQKHDQFPGWDSNSGESIEKSIDDEKERRRKERERIKRVLRASLLLALILVISIIGYKLFNKKIEVSIGGVSSVIAGSPLVVFGNLPEDRNSVEVYFNSTKGNIVQYSSKSLQVIVPTVEKQGGDVKVKVAVVAQGDTAFVDGNLIIRQNIRRDTTAIASNNTNTKVTTKDIAKVKPVSKDSSKFKKVVIVLKKPKNKTDNNVKTDDAANQPSIEVKKEAPKKIINIYEFVSVSTDFKRRTFGGIKDIKVIVRNSSDYELDNVAVQVRFLKNDDEELDKKNVFATNIKAHSSLTLNIEGTFSGKKVDAKVFSVVSKQLNEDLR